MNILYLSADRGIPVRGHKGAAVHVRAMADAFSRAGHSVMILTPRPGPADGPALMAEIVDVPLPPLPTAPDEGAAREQQSVAYTHALFEAARHWHDRCRFAFVYERHSLWSTAGARLSTELGLPLVLEVNAPLLEEAGRYRSLGDAALAAEIERRQFTAASMVAVVSEPLRAYVVRRGVAPARVHVLPNGVDPQQFHPAVRGGSVRGAYGLQGRLVAGFVGRPRPWHDLETLLAAAAQLRGEDPRYHLLLVGEMPDDLPARLAHHGLSDSTTLTGPVPHGDVPRHIAAMDVAVSTHLPADPSEFYFSPLKLFEYLACGVPVVAAGLGQPSQIIRQGETGYLYPPGDAAALAGRIRHLLSDPARAREVAWQGAVEVLEHFTWDNNARRIVEAIANPSGLKPEGSAGLPVFDPKLRQRLYRATRADLAAPYLAKVLEQAQGTGHCQPLEIERIGILKYKVGRRCVLAYELGGQGEVSERLQVVGKVFRDERGRRLHALQSALWNDGFGPPAEDGIHVPRSLGFVPEMRMHVQQRSPGKTLNELVQAGPITPFIPRCAEALAKLHSTSARLDLTAYWLEDELASLARFRAELVERLPGQAARIDALHARLQAWAATLPAATELVPVHRDFYYSQVLIDGPQLTLIDFDLLALGDPAIDVANFMAHLDFLGLDKLGDLDALAGDARVFLDAYSRWAHPDGTFDRRRAFYQAATFFRLMNVVASRPGLAHLFDTLTQRTAQSLTGMESRAGAEAHE